MAPGRGTFAGIAAATFLSLSTVSAAPPQTFVGVISDSECGSSHATMRMADTDAGCVKACIDAHGAAYVLWDGKREYTLNDREHAKPFPGVRVKVVGTLQADGKTIAVDSISAER
jgi:hypothetical protein